MPQPNRIVKNYFLKNNTGRGSLWSLWLTPKDAGPNDIYFAGSGYLRTDSNKYGFIFHLSIHRDGWAHIKYEDNKIHRFELINKDNFCICSIFTNADDLTVSQLIPPNIKGDLCQIDVASISKNTDGSWIELMCAHLQEAKIKDFLEKFTAKDIDFEEIDRISIGQNRQILVLARYRENVNITGLKIDVKDACDTKQRLTVWGYHAHNDKHINIYDLPANNLERMQSIIS